MAQLGYAMAFACWHRYRCFTKQYRNQAHMAQGWGCSWCRFNFQDRAGKPR